MNQQTGYPLPPPPPTPGVNSPTGPVMSERQRPSIATNLVRTLGNPSQTPVSSSSYGPATPWTLTPGTPSPLNPRTPSALAPPSAVSPRTTTMEPYDPRQWSNRGQVSGTQMVFQNRGSAAFTGTREATGMEGVMPSPPPPYSPDGTSAGSNQQPRASPVLETAGYTASPLQGHRLSTTNTPAPMSPSFPPPPPHTSRHRDRSSSNQRGFFNLANLRKSSTNSEYQGSQTLNALDTSEPKPPAAKRAASTGHLYSNGIAEASSSGVPQLGPARKASPANTWKPGMPLPGPPPGPPPSGSRTQSLNRYTEGSSRSNSVGSDRSIETPHHRRVAVASSLGPVPPTPADWVDPDASSQTAFQPLRIDTGSGQNAPLSRRPAKRDSAAQGIQDRRSRSRAARDGADTMSPDGERATDVVFSPIDGAISRRREQARPLSRYVASTEATATSPSQQQPAAQSSSARGNVLTPPYTPAVGKVDDEGSRRTSLKAPGSASSERLMSQVLHQSLDETAIPAPLSPARQTPGGSAKTSARLDSFQLQALERHRAFIEKEANAASDEERLELFANFLVHESRLRRDRYTEAYNAMAGEIVDLTRDMWRSYTRQSKRAITPSTSQSSFDPTVGVAYGNMPSSASSFEEYTPGTDVGSLPDGEGMERSDSRQWGEAFKPSLSPIPSMNVSSNKDEEGSRGRAPSRWWEQSQGESNSVGNPDRIQKTHRETKYMGVNPAALQDGDRNSPRTAFHTGGTPGPSTENFALGPNEYPPEKVGLHDGTDLETPIPTPGRMRKASAQGSEPIDVSRLVTLPPPYPRHYPALKNSHPLLADLRSEYRSLANHARIEEIREAYTSQDTVIQRQQDEASNQRRKQCRLSIQEKVSDGRLSFADAAKAEADFDVEEAERGKANARANFNLFETNLAHPLNAVLTEGLEKANTCIDQLRVELESGNEVSDPNQTQEEGDEHPERLEKLTLLKWLFETREHLHKEMFDLHADRSAKYSEVILTPYRISKQQAKLDEANAFFTKDSHERQIKFAKDSLKRFEKLQQIVDSNVSRGVEDQLSAFWDIAPALLEVAQHIPANMAELAIDIPEPEYAENPAYNAHPLQYLYSLLSHAEKSAYQFIESQTNLLCLLHEVKTATTNSSLRLLEAERTAADPDATEIGAEMQQARVMQEERLTEDLKEKVGEVDRQWKEALGEGLEDCKQRVRGFLEESGGWEDGLEG